MGQARFLSEVARKIAPGRGIRHPQSPRERSSWWWPSSSSWDGLYLYHSGHDQQHRYFSAVSTAEPSSIILKSGPSLQLGTGRLAQLTESSVVGHCGQTLVLATVCCDASNNLGTSNFLTVEYRQKAAATGQIPTHNRQRQDGRIPSRLEVLAARALDRSLRPLLRLDNGDDDNNNPTAARTQQQQQQRQAKHYHVHAVVQAVGKQGYPVTTAVNAAAAALRSQLQQPVAATYIGVTRQGNYVQDPVPYHHQSSSSSSNNNDDDEDDNDDVVGELLLAGTPDGNVVMLEWTSRPGCSLPETQFANLLQVGVASLQPIFDTMNELHELQQQKLALDSAADEENNDPDETTRRIRASLGLPPQVLSGGTESSTINDDSQQSSSNTTSSIGGNRHELLRGAISYCQARLGDATERLFGRTDTGTQSEQPDTNQPSSKKRQKKSGVRVYPNDNSLPALLSKSVRGRREQIVLEEISRLVDEFLLSLSSDISIVVVSDSDRTWLHSTTANRLLKQALWSTSSQCRADGRPGPRTIRPLHMAVPALPPTVHGSALFARGDTQVVCTVTLGPPRDGQPEDETVVVPTAATVAKNKEKDRTENDDADENDSLDKYPVGSLRFLRTQEALESDLNSRRSKADKERTGDSGRLADVRRAFLQYDFPAYSTGDVPLQRGIDRRAVGHGALAERALLPVLPDPDAFPYSIRMTSEVTDSNGSSSMASVCGVTLALLDAGVPLRAPVAGVSVGLAIPAVDGDNNDQEQPEQELQNRYSLLLDITGTEDHYGAMDFKIAGTRNGVTAAQLDVKQPLPVQVLVEALNLAKNGRGAILQTMSELTANSPIANLQCRPEPKATAPRVEVVRFDPNRKRDLVGPGGVVLRQLEERYGVELDMTQEGQCLLFGTDREMVRKAKMTVMELVADVNVGEVYTGTVIETKDFGAVLELLRNKEGLLHVSEMITSNSNDPRTHPEGAGGFVRQQLKLGQKIDVLCIGVDPLQGSVKLSQKALAEKRQTETKVEVI